MNQVARVISIVLSLAFVAALGTAVVCLLRLSGTGFRGLLLNLARILRRCPDHPSWELLAQ